MTLVSRYDTPASLRDLPVGSQFYDDWHNYLAGEIDNVPGSGGGQFYDASEVDVTPIGERSLVWMAFPRDVLMPNRDDRTAAYIAAEDRLVQNEYCEWRVTRNAAKKITKVVFVTESPEYWQKLWAADRRCVVSLYNELLGTTAVVESDLQDGNGDYNLKNDWNTTDGIVHLIQNINKLELAIGLAEGAADSEGVRDNYEMNPIAETSVDPRVVFDVSSLVRKGLFVTLREPIGLYIAGWDDTGWTKPNGKPVGDYWSIARGRSSEVLRLEYEVPAVAGFVVGDIRIGGRPIEWGGQIAEHVTVMIAGTAGLPPEAENTLLHSTKRGRDEKAKVKTKINRKRIQEESLQTQGGRN